jgi:hypothetical protein
MSKKRDARREETHQTGKTFSRGNENSSGRWAQEAEAQEQGKCHYNVTENLI